jgi:NADPH-dependent 2,4-dienoyl-CoA reductase/sulfur reductase-like enzyme/rhodanese-related sulfurtransferase
VKTIIVGGVAGGMSAATRLRRLDEHAEITVYEQGPHVSFANCGLPYFIGGVIDSEESLLLQTPDSLWHRFRLDIRVNSRIVSIDPATKTVTGTNVLTGEEFTDSYDALILSPGARPRQLTIPGAERALSLRDVPDAVRIKDAVDGIDAGTAVILGGGFIGVEVAENLRHRGMQVTLVQQASTILPQFDPEMIEPLQATLESNGIMLALGRTAVEVTPTEVVLDNGQRVSADLVISAIGVTADAEFAAQAGLRMGSAGGIWVDENHRTSNPDIFAVGDAAQKHNVLTGSDQMIWLANLANRHGRAVADVVAGVDSPERDSQGTGIIGAFGLVAAITGLSEKGARLAGLDYRVVHAHPGSHAGYYPGSATLALKVIFDPETGKILGAQATGTDGADKRIDVLATAVYAGLTVDDLMNLELAYAPQFGSAKDAVNQLGYVANNVWHERTPSVQWHELDERVAAGATILDVRTETENSEAAIPGALLIPVDDLRARLAEVPDGEVIVHCRVGQRGHTATQLLRQNGKNAHNLDGGYLTWIAGTESLERVQRVLAFP